MSAEVWATWTGAVVALAAAAVASIQASRANSAAHRSAAADERAAAAAERANELAEQQAAKYTPDWRLTRVSPMTVQLTNGSDETALEMTVTRLDGGPLWSDVPRPPEDLGPRESIVLTAPNQMLRAGHRLLVTWHRSADGGAMTQRVSLTNP